MRYEEDTPRSKYAEVDNSRKVPKWLWITSGSIAVAVLLLCVIAWAMTRDRKVDESADSEKPQPKSSTPSAPIPAIDGNSAARDYEENSVGADGKWRGKRIRVTKDLGKIGRSETSGLAYITSPWEYGGTSTPEEGTAMIFYFTKDDEETIAGVKQTYPPQALTIEGICRGKKDRFVVVENCKLIKIEKSK